MNPTSGERRALTVLSRREVYAGRVLRLEVDTVREHTGASGIREVVRHHGSVAALAVHDDGRIALVRQYRHPVGDWLWELPAGLLNKGEVPMAGALRELEEETGLRARQAEHLITFFTTPGFCEEEMFVFRATGLTEVPPRPDDDEDIERLICPLAEAEAMLARGEIREGKTVVALLLEIRRRLTEVP